MKTGPIFRIAVDLGAVIPAGAVLDANSFPTLARAVALITEQAGEHWRQYASGVPMPNGKVIRPGTGSYLRSIQTRSLGDFSGEAFSELRYAQVIEEGGPAFDMKRWLQSSLKVRRTAKDDKRYLIIPFRHEGPDASYGSPMTQRVHEWWQSPDRLSSHVTGTHARPTGQRGTLPGAEQVYDIKTRAPATVVGWRYQWGSRLTKADLTAMGHDDKQVRRMQGMVNFRRPDHAGGAAHSQYVTFRVMKEGSPGWIRPAREGLYPARTVAETLQPIAEKAFERAVQEDVQRMMGG